MKSYRDPQRNATQLAPKIVARGEKFTGKIPKPLSRGPMFWFYTFPGGIQLEDDPRLTEQDGAIIRQLWEFFINPPKSLNEPPPTFDEVIKGRHFVRPSGRAAGGVFRLIHRWSKRDRVLASLTKLQELGWARERSDGRWEFAHGGILMAHAHAPKLPPRAERMRQFRRENPECAAAAAQYEADQAAARRAKMALVAKPEAQS